MLNPFIVQKVASDLFDAFSKNELSNLNGGLYYGKIGVALFFAEYYLFSNKDKYANAAYDLVSDIFENIDKERTNNRSLSGISGIGWGMEYLVSRNFFNKHEVESYVAKLEEFVYLSLDEDFKSGNYDLMHGHIGKLLFLLKRKKSANSAARELISKSVVFINALANTDDMGAYWTSSYSKGKQDEASLGLSHGTPSIILYLCYLLDMKLMDIKQETLVKKMIKQGAMRLLAVMPKQNKRLSWCYGDLGIGLCLIKAGETISDQFLVMNGKETLLQVSNVTINQAELASDKHLNLVDSCFCHGITGIVHIFSRLRQKFRNKEFADAEQYWLKQLLKLVNTSNQFYNFRTVNHNGQWVTDFSLLEGVSGIGLVLLKNYVSASQGEGHEDWDSTFFTKI